MKRRLLLLLVAFLFLVALAFVALQIDTIPNEPTEPPPGHMSPLFLGLHPIIVSPLFPLLASIFGIGLVGFCVLL